MRKCTLCAALALACACVLAKNTRWYGVPGSWSDASIWSAGVPASGDTAYLYPKAESFETEGATNAVLLTADTSTSLFRLYFADTDYGLFPGTAAFDGNGHRFTIPTASGVYTSSGGFIVRSYMGGTGFQVSSSGSSTTGWMDAEDPYFLFHNDGKIMEFTVARGHVTAPFGTSLMSDNGGTVGKQDVYTVYKCMPGSYHVKFTGSNTVWHTGSMQFRGNAATNILTISDGAYVEVDGRFDGYGECWSPRTVLNLDNGTLFSNGTSTPNGGWIEINHDSKQATWKNKSYELNMSNGALLLTTNCAIGIQGNTRTRMTDSAIRSGDALKFGSGNNCTQDVYIARSTLSCGMFFFSSAYPSQKPQMTSRIEDTAITFGTSSVVGCGDHTWRNVAVKGPYQSYTLSLPDCTSLALYGTNTFSDFTLDLGGYTSYTPSGKASFAVRGGLTDITGANMGTWFPAEIVVSDGTLRTTRYGQYGGTRNVVLCNRFQTRTDSGKDSTVILESGGTLVAMQLYGGTGATTRGGTGRAVVRGDGGTLKPGVTLDSTSYFLRYLDAVEATAKGLYLDSNNSDYVVTCPLTNAVNATGLFVKTGAGSLTFNDSDITVSRFRIDSGSVVLGSGTTVSGTQLVLTEGTRLTFPGAATAPSALTVPNATIVLSPTDRLTVSGALSFDRLHVVYSSAPTQGEAIDVITLTGARNTAAETAWCAAFDDSGFTDGTYMSFSTQYDSSSGKTYYRATRRKASEPLPESANTRWMGTGAWKTDANWEGGLAPTRANRALFDSETAGSPVTISAGDTAGAVRFAAARGYTLSGSASLAMAGERGANVLESSAGTNTVSAPLSFASRLDVKVDAGSKLILSGGGSGAGFAKAGSGRLDVSKKITLDSEPSVSGGGWTRLEGAGALSSSAASYTLGYGTFETDSKASSSVSGKLKLAEVSDTTKPLIFKNEGDIEMDAADATGGCFIKRGGGKLTLNFPAGETTTFPYGNGVKSLSYPTTVDLKFPDDGSAPVRYTTGAEVSDAYWGLNVHEGELVFKGTSSSVVSFGSAIIGMAAVADQTQRTIFTIDGAHVDMGAGAVYVGQCAAFSPRTGEYYPRNPMLRIVNGGYLYTHSFKVGNGCWYASYDHPQPEVRVENGTLVTASETTLSLPRAPSGGKGVWYTTNSVVQLRTPYISGGIEAVFDSTELQWWWYGGAYWVATSYSAGGTVEFRNGTRVFARYYDTKDLQCDLTFIWDNARQMTEETYTEPWSAGLTSTNSSLEHCSFEMRNEGMLLNVADGKLFESAVRFWGTGGMTKTGPGTLKFTGNAYQFTGCLNLEGVLDLTEMTEPVAGATFGGTGTICGRGIAGATFASPTIVRQLDDDGYPVTENFLELADASISGTIRVDFGHGKDNPVVPHISPRLPLFRVSGTTTVKTGIVKVIGVDGALYSGKIVIEDNIVYLTSVYKYGLMILYR